ncbi:MAG: hypothetical protein CL811_10840 [Colwelliaceae bacterium]|nr:hypothetical protein [Colwelliaceae bacterium]|tara:strand:- start:1877 stop:3148 length:1272 start_codon:yes stop_codon:yes gene_type:complete
MKKDKKIKVLMIADHIFTASGVGTQTRYVAEALLESGKFSIINLAGAKEHADYRPIKTEEWGDDLKIIPVKGYGNPNLIRTQLRIEKPDILWFMTDPRYFEWLWSMSDEIRSLCPMVYYHVWDNYPVPKFNKIFYSSTDKILTISKLTDDIVAKAAPEVSRQYIPHAVSEEQFFPMGREEIESLRKDNFDWAKKGDDRFVLFFNSRNARRKLPGTLLWWFAEWARKVGVEKTMLLMHTNPRDEHGPNLEAILEELDLPTGTVLFSNGKLPPDAMNVMYNMADVTCCISDAEGFGLSSLESLAAGTPVISTKTGGLQDQITDGKEEFGVSIEPASKTIMGSQNVPYIYEDRISKEDFFVALDKLYDMKKEERVALGLRAAEYIKKDFNFKDFKKVWVQTMLDVHEKFGSWDTRKGYKAWHLTNF